MFKAVNTARGHSSGPPPPGNSRAFRDLARTSTPETRPLYYIYYYYRRVPRYSDYLVRVYVYYDPPDFNPDTLRNHV